MRVLDLHRLSLVVCGVLISLPFLNPYHYYPFLTFYTEWLAFVIGLVALAAMAMRSSRNTVPIPGMCIGLFVLTAVLVLQAALDQVAYPLRSAVGALYMIWAALLVMLGAWLKSELGEVVVSARRPASRAVPPRSCRAPPRRCATDTPPGPALLEGRAPLSAQRARCTCRVSAPCFWKISLPSPRAQRARSQRPATPCRK